MAKVLDVRGSGGQLVIVGSTVVLPSGRIGVATPGSIRFNPTTNCMEFFDGTDWAYLLTSKSNDPGGMSYEGVWDATANDPPLVSGEGTDGSIYMISVAGHAVLDGIMSWEVGDFAVFKDKWSRINRSSITIAPPSVDPQPEAPLDADQIREIISAALSGLLDTVFGSMPGAMLVRGDHDWTVIDKNNLIPPPPPVLEISINDITGALGFMPARFVNGIAPVNGNIGLRMVSSFNGRDGDQRLTADDIVEAIGFAPLDRSGVGLPVSFGGSMLSSPYGSGQILFRAAMGFPVTFPKGLSRSTAVCLSPSTDQTSLSILKNGTMIGSIFFMAGSSTGAFVFQNEVRFDATDILELDGANPADPTFGNLTFTLVGFR
jgi:hypothetical protein